jgi:hypothetical protein
MKGIHIYEKKRREKKSKDRDAAPRAFILEHGPYLYHFCPFTYPVNWSTLLGISIDGSGLLQTYRH